MKTEPLVTLASITAGATALLGLLVAFGVPLTEGQQVAVLAVVAVRLGRRPVHVEQHELGAVGVPRDRSVTVGDGGQAPELPAAAVGVHLARIVIGLALGGAEVGLIAEHCGCPLDR